MFQYIQYYTTSCKTNWLRLFCCSPTSKNRWSVNKRREGGALLPVSCYFSQSRKVTRCSSSHISVKSRIVSASISILFGSAKELQFLTVCLCWRHIFDKEHSREEIFCLSCQFCQSSTRPQPTTAKYLSSHLFLVYSQRSRVFWFLAFNNSWRLSVLFSWTRLFVYVSKCSSCWALGSTASKTII